MLRTGIHQSAFSGVVFGADLGILLDALTTNVKAQLGGAAWEILGELRDPTTKQDTLIFQQEHFVTGRGDFNLCTDASDSTERS